MKRLFINLLLVLLLIMLMPATASAALTAGVGDVVRPTAYWWTGLAPLDATGDLGLGWMQEVETQLEAWTLDGGTTLTFPTNGGTFANSTKHAFTWTERSEDIIWTVGTSDDIAVTSSTGVVLFDYGTIVTAANQIIINPISVAVGTVEGTIRYDSDDNKFLGRNDSSWVEFGASAGTPAGSDTYLQYNDSSSFGGIATIIWDDTNLEFQDDQSLAIGTSAATQWLVNFDNSVDDQLLFITAGTVAGAITDPLFEILVGTTPFADQQVFGIAKGTQASNTALFTIDEDGDAEIAGDLTVAGSFYQAAIASAAAGVVDLTVDASSSGNITIGGISTGPTIFPGNVDFTGDSVDIGDLATNDTLSILAKIDTDLLIDDDTTNSPALVLRDAGENDWQFVKVNGAGGNLTVTSDSATSDFHIKTGNLKVGDGSEGVALNGEDAFITGTLEVNGAVQFDGAYVGNSTTTLNGDVAINDQILVTLDAADEEVIITNSHGTITADNMVEFVMAAQSTNTYVLALTQTPDGDADNDYLILADNTGSNFVFKIEQGGTTTWALDPASQIIIGSSANTTTDGAINIDHATLTVGSEAMNIKVVATNTSSNAQAIVIDLDDDITTGGDLVGVEIQASDNDSDGTVIGLQTLGLLDVGWNAEVGAAKKAMTIDAKTVPNTGSTGVVDIDFESKVANAEAIHIEATFTTGAAGVAVAGMEIELVNNSGNVSDILYGLIINVTDSTASGKEKGIYIKGAGIDAGIQLDTGYIRVGTGGTPTVTPGDDDIYAEGTIEADGGLSIGDTILQSVTIEITNSQLDDLKNTPKELVAAPSAGELIEFVSAILVHEYGGSNVWTEADDNLVIEYDGGSGAAVSETIEMTGFITATQDQLTRAIPVKDPIGTAASQVAKNIVLINNDDNFAGNAGNDNLMQVIVTYRIVSALGL